MSDTTQSLPPSPEAPTLPPSAPAVSDAAPRLDSVCVPGYDILSTLGRGGMGVVYQARQTKLGRIVALKMILSGVHADAADLARFRTEAEAIARLQHPNIVQIYEIGEQGGLPFFSLEYCAGGSLEKKLNGTPLPPKKAAALVETLARGMQTAHDKGVIHRDLKPANVLLAEDGTPKITDFGLAKKLDEAGQTATGAVMGTPSYMAPEQAASQAKQITPRTDIYALGAILFAYRDLGRVIAALVQQMDEAEGKKAAEATLDALLSNPRCMDAQFYRPVGIVAEWIAPRDLADLLTAHPLPPDPAAAVLRQLEPLACRHFETIDDAVRWFRDRDAEITTP